jgi:putative hydrolase of HD superfamily
MQNSSLPPEKSYTYFSVARFLTEVITLEDELRKLNYLNPFIGCDSPTIAHHIVHTVAIGRVLAVLAEENGRRIDRTTLDNLTLWHDMPETRYGDIGRAHRVYVTINEEKARADAYAHLPFGQEIIGIIERFEETGVDHTTLLARDADAIYVITTIRDLLAKGLVVRDPEQRVANTIHRLKTEEGKALAKQIATIPYDQMWSFLAQTASMKNVVLPLPDDMLTQLVASWALKRLEKENIPDSRLFDQVLAKNQTSALVHDADDLYVIMQLKRDALKGRGISGIAPSRQAQVRRTASGRMIGQALSEINLYDWLDVTRGFLEVLSDGSTRKV